MQVRDEPEHDDEAGQDQPFVEQGVLEQGEDDPQEQMEKFLGFAHQSTAAVGVVVVLLVLFITMKLALNLLQIFILAEFNQNTVILHLLKSYL